LNPVTPLSACAGFALCFLYANLFEYVFHRWVLHRRSRLLLYSYRVHSLLHHQVFHGDATYHVQHEEDRDLILFRWWQGPLMLAAHAPAVWALEVISGFAVLWGAMTALAAYYALYEYLHWCMHNPAGRWIERRSAFQILDAHHRLHHGLWRVNFNVVLPIADAIFGTFRRATPGQDTSEGAARPCGARTRGRLAPWNRRSPYPGSAPGDQGRRDGRGAGRDPGQRPRLAARVGSQ
jgi:hypothetical protein